VRAIVQRRLGAPGVLRIEQVPEPEPGTGQVLIEVAIANITFIETQLRAGLAPDPAMLPTLPAIPGNGVGGVVVAVGPGGDPELIGTPVVTSTGGSGAYAERAVATAETLIAIPPGLTTAQAVALLADGRTALGLMQGAAVAAGETVLVESAAGGVGTLLVQLARAAGARVIATAGSARKLALAYELGADAAANHSAPGWADAVEPVNVAFDGIGGEIGLAAFGLVRAGGRFMPFGLASGAFARIDPAAAAARGVSVVRGARPTAAESAELSRKALALAAAGRLRPVIGQTFPLEQAAAAHAAIEARSTLGKTLLIVREG
jgi:NADPH2:quinone reductase